MPELPALVSPEPGATHPSYDTVRAMVRTWTSHGGDVSEARQPSRIRRRLVGARPQILEDHHSAILIPFMGPRLDWLPSADSLRDREVYLHCWDVLESNDNLWERVFEETRPRRVSMTSRQAANRWRARGLDAVWVPEAVDVALFAAARRPLSERDIDVLELGRRWEELHRQIAKPLRDRGHTHLYQPDTTTLVFPDFPAFVDGIGRSKTVVCIPGARTHPLRYGGDSLLTMRYLEAMASGALPIGEMPEELVHLAGYDPGVSLLVDEPGLKIIELLDRFDQYMDLIHRNSESVASWGSWEARLEQFHELVSK